MSVVRERNVAKLDSTYVKQKENAEIATSRKRKLLYRRLSIFVVFAAFISYFMISTIYSQMGAVDAKQAQKVQLQKKLASLKKQREILKEDIVKLNDDDYIGKLARKEYFFSDRNEIIFTIPEEGKEKSTIE